MYSHAIQFSNPNYQLVLLLLFNFNFELLLAYIECVCAEFIGFNFKVLHFCQVCNCWLNLQTVLHAQCAGMFMV